MATLPVATRNELVDFFTAKWEVGAGPATIQVRTGVKPAATSDAATGTLLLTYTLAEPAWGAAVAGASALDASPVITTTGVAAGTATWARCFAPDGSVVCDVTAGGAGSGAELLFDNAVIAIGQTVNLNSGSITQPV